MKNIQQKSKIELTNRTFWLIVVIVILLNIVLGYWFYSNNNLKVKVGEFENPYPLIDPARSFIGQEHYIVNIQPLREKLREMAKEFGNNSVSIYVEFLNTGGNIAINPDTYVWPASLTKVPLAMAVMKKIQDGEWRMDNELVLFKGDADDKSGDPQNPLAKNPIGTRFTIQKLLEEMLVNSDNTAYFILLRNVEQDDLKDVIVALGMEHLFTKEGKISAKEYSRILRSMYTASFLNRANSEYLLSVLDKATFNEFLSKDIKDLVPFPHKYGEYLPYNAYSDSGIVYIPNRPYIISVMVQGDKDKPFEEEKKRVAEFMVAVSNEAYNYFLNVKN